MEERWTEIRFYYFIIKLLKTFRYSASTVDVVDAYCNLGGIDNRIIKNLMRDIKDHKGLILSYSEEATYIARYNNISYRDTYKITGVSLSQQQKFEKEIRQRPNMYQGITSKLTKLEYQEVEKFVKIIDIMKGI